MTRVAPPYLTPLSPPNRRFAPDWDLSDEPPWPAPDLRDRLPPSTFAPTAYAGALWDAIPGTEDLGQWVQDTSDDDLVALHEQATTTGLDPIGKQDQPWWLQALGALETLSPFDPEARASREPGLYSGTMRALYGMPEVQGMPQYTGAHDVGADPGVTRRYPRFQRPPTTPVMGRTPAPPKTQGEHLEQATFPNLYAHEGGDRDAWTGPLAALEVASATNLLRRGAGAALKPWTGALERKSWLDRTGPGPQQIFGGKLSQTADLDKLRLAEEMFAEREDLDTIFTETGWWKAPDDEWRYEIPDTLAQFREEGLAPRPDDLADLQHRERVLDAVTRAKDTGAAEYGPEALGPEALGNYAPDEFKGWLNEWLDARMVPDTDDATLLHNTQLGEAFRDAKEYYDQPLEMAQADVDFSREYMNSRRAGTMSEVLEHPELYEAYPELADLPVKMDRELMEQSGVAGYARDLGGNRMIGLNPNTLATHPGYMRSLMLHEGQHMVQGGEGFARGGTPGEFPQPSKLDVDKQSELLRTLRRAQTRGGLDKAIELLGPTGKLSEVTPEQMEQLAEALPERDLKALFETGMRYPGLQLDTVRDRILPVAIKNEQDELTRLEVGRKNPNYSRDEYMRLYGEAEARAVQDRADPDALDVNPWEMVGADLPFGTPLNVRKR